MKSNDVIITMLTSSYIFVTAKCLDIDDIRKSLVRSKNLPGIGRDIPAGKFLLKVSKITGRCSNVIFLTFDGISPAGMLH